jgi:activator of 2-hydroxyglutaryl-CoA dehydratase
VTISSTCTVFAESEIVTHIAAGAPKSAIIAGLHESIAARVASMVARIPVSDVVMLTGGVARNSGVARMLEERLGRRVLVLPEAQITGAIGAALLARESVQASG